MLIRSAQIELFDNADTPHFTSKLTAHIRDDFPQHSAVLGDEGVREVVRYGMAQSKTHQFTQQSTVSLFTDLTLLLGRHFDTDPQIPWASWMLSADAALPELERGQRLHTAATAYLNEVSGPANEFIDAAQSRLLNEPVQINATSSAAFGKDVSQRLDRVWPEKNRQLTEESRSALIRDAVAKARLYKIESQTGALMCIVMMFLLGSGFDKDPMFAWAQKILSSDLERDAKLQQLHQASMTCLRQWCAKS